MPELPDITVYIEALESRTLGQPLERVRSASPFLLRTVDPPLSAVEGKAVTDTTDMLNLIAQLKPNSKAKMTVLRKTQELALDLMVGTRPKIKREAVE